MKLNKLLSLAAIAGLMATSAAMAADVRIAMVPKSLGNAFFEAARDGGMEAAKEIGGVELIFNAPAVVTAEGQIEVINALIAQRVDAIAISSNDPDALGSRCQKGNETSVSRSCPSTRPLAPEGRQLHKHPATASRSCKSAAGNGGRCHWSRRGNRDSFRDFPQSSQPRMSGSRR